MPDLRLPERAWDARGAWTGHTVPCTGPAPQAKHEAGCSLGGKCGVFVCLWCRRPVPWCEGGGGEDALDDVLCSDCWLERHEDDRDDEEALDV